MLDPIMTRMNLSIMKVNYKPSAIIFDEIDSITKVDKGTIPTILSFIKKTKQKNNPDINYTIPILLISDHKTKSKDIIKYCSIFELHRPTIYSVFPYIQNMCTLEGLNINETALQYLLHNLEVDFRQIIIALCYLKDSFGKKEIDSNHINDILPYIFKKDIDYTIISASSKFLNSSIDISEVNTYFDIDQSVLPLIIHENIGTVYKKKNDPVIFDHLEKYYNNIVCADMFNSYAHNNVSWAMNDYYGILSCYLLGKKKKKAYSPNNNKIYTNVTNIKYTNYFSKNAHLFYNINTKIQLCQKLEITDNHFNCLNEEIIFYFYHRLPFPPDILDILYTYNITSIEIEKMVKLSIHKDIYENDNKTIKKKINLYLKQIKF
jgi:DNA polymerase III delta subunit